jgi:hypothetical protein
VSTAAADDRDGGVSTGGAAGWRGGDAWGAGWGTAATGGSIGAGDVGSADAGAATSAACAAGRRSLIGSAPTSAEDGAGASGG